MSQNNFYITTPIYYPSGDPHMGHAYSSILADVFARFKRNDNNNVFFLTGTDEHGLKIQTAATKNGLDPLMYCDKISLIFKDLTTKLNLSNDDFIRTTEKRHHKSVSDLWDRLVKSGDIYLSKYKGWYSVSDEAYYNSDEIIEKGGERFSTFSGSLVEWVEEESFFFKLSSIVSKNWLVVKYLLDGPINIARSFVIEPLSTHSIQIFSKILAKLINSSLLSNLPLCDNPLAHAKIDAIGFVDVSFPCWCNL